VEQNIKIVNDPLVFINEPNIIISNTLPKTITAPTSTTSVLDIVENSSTFKEHTEVNVETEYNSNENVILYFPSYAY